MTLYPRRDYQALGPVPGCDREHLRPQGRNGEPVHPWGLDCPAHQAHFCGDGKPKILKYVTDRKTGQVIRQERVPDAHPGFSTTPDTIPLTPDEEETRGLKLEKGENQLRALESLLALKAGGIDLTSRPEVLFYLQESGLPAEAFRALKGVVVCVNGHDAGPGSRFCPECGVSMDARGAIASPAAEPAVDLAGMHVQSLRKMARDRGLPDKGSKNDLIQRLAA